MIKNKAKHAAPKTENKSHLDENFDHDVYFRDGEKKPTVADQKMSGFHGAEEDEIMEKIIKAYSDYAKDPYQ